MPIAATIANYVRASGGRFRTY